MTQMLLFDAPATVSVPVSTQPVSEASPPADALPTEDRSVSLFGAAGDEIQHMGDLAKLVLLRYELLHQRRAARRRRQSHAR